MTQEEMAQRLNISPEELEVMRAQQAAGTLNTDYPTLNLHLGRMLSDQWADRWVNIKQAVDKAWSSSPDFETLERRLQVLEEALTRISNLG